MKRRDAADARAALGLGPARAPAAPKPTGQPGKRAPAPKPAAGELRRFTVWLPVGLADRLRAAAWELRESQGQLVADALARHLDALERSHGKPFKPVPARRRGQTP
jgi:hypothetical protein